MEEVIGFATRIETVLSLIAFVSALVWAGYRAKLHRDEKLAVEGNSKNLEILSGYFPVDTGSLTKEQKFNLALEQIRSRDQNSKRWFWLSALFGVLLIGYSAFHQWRGDPSPAPTPTPVPAPSPAPTPAPSPNEKASNELHFASKSLLASFGTKDSCQHTAKLISPTKLSSFVSSSDNTECTQYAKFTFVPLDKDKLAGEEIAFTVVPEFKGTQPGGAFEISGSEGTVVSISQNEVDGAAEVKLKNHQQYVFHGNSQVGANKGGGTSEIVVSIHAKE